MLPRLICLTFDRQTVLRACSRACAKTGNRIAARIAMMAMTTSNSIKVNPLLWVLVLRQCIPFPPGRYRRAAVRRALASDCLFGYHSSWCGSIRILFKVGHPLSLSHSLQFLLILGAQFIDVSAAFVGLLANPFCDRGFHVVGKCRMWGGPQIEIADPSN